MNRPILFDAKQSREVLKAIRYGMDLQVAPLTNCEEGDWIRSRLASLRKHYLARRALIDEKRSAFGNVIFYQLLKEKYAEFEYRVDERGAPLSNLYDFKVDGRLPSLLTMLINDNVRRISEPERRYGLGERYAPVLEEVERLFEEAMLVYPDRAAFVRFLETVLHARQTGAVLQLVAAICPDYSWVPDGDGVRYTFESVGVEPGLAGTKFLSIMPSVMRFLDALGVAYALNVYGGDFESLAYQDGHSPLGVTREQFVSRVREQIANIVDRLGVPARSGFFFDEVGGEAAWVTHHEAVYQALAGGDYGAAPLDDASMDAIFATRLPLYTEWFKGADERALREVFLKQAAEYALMGQIYARRFEHFVVLGVDHHRMAPFYSFGRAAAVVYRQTDYIVEKDSGMQERKVRGEQGEHTQVSEISEQECVR